MNTKSRVTTTTGKRIYLTTDDTLTLAFPGMIESTPATLRATISERSLRKLAESPDSNESSKAESALALKLQLSDHGAGSKSAQVFADGKLVADINL